jgi:hypothetical protein
LCATPTTSTADPTFHGTAHHSRTVILYVSFPRSTRAAHSTS